MESNIQELNSKRLKRILQKTPNNRNDFDIDYLASIVQDVEFFQKLVQEASPKHLKSCCKYMFYERHASESYVFHHGEKGKNFYIILSGEVCLEVPKKDGSTKELAKLKSGKSFGELALNQRKPRAASVRCIEDSEFIVFDKKSYDLVLKGIIREKEDQNVRFLRQFDLFKTCSYAVLVKLGLYLMEKNFIRKQVVYREKEETSYIYFVTQGEFKLHKSMGSPTQKHLFKRTKPKTGEVALLGKLQILGEEDLFSEQYSYTCICSSYTGTLLSLPVREVVSKISEESTENLQLRISTKETIRNNRLEFVRTATAASSSPFNKKFDGPSRIKRLFSKPTKELINRNKIPKRKSQRLESPFPRSNSVMKCITPVRIEQNLNRTRANAFSTSGKEVRFLRTREESRKSMPDKKNFKSPQTKGYQGISSIILKKYNLYHKLWA